MLWRPTKKPISSSCNPHPKQLTVGVDSIIVTKFRAAAWTDVVVPGRIGQILIGTNRAGHTLILPHFPAKVRHLATVIVNVCLRHYIERLHKLGRYGGGASKSSIPCIKSQP